MYIDIVKLKIGPRFGGFKGKNWSKLKVTNWPKFLFHCFVPIFKVFLDMFKNTNSVTLCQNSDFAKLWGCQR